MGIDARLVVYAPDEAKAVKACTAAFARIAELDSVMSDYRKDSELMRLCDRAGQAPVKVSRDLFVVLTRASEVSRRSHGAFDVTVGPLVALWRKARKTSELPDPGAIAAARKLVGWQKVRLFPSLRKVKLLSPGMRLDLGGIAKGYAADEAQKTLKANGIGRALVEMGGDIVLSGPPPGKKGWTIRVPNAGDDHGPVDMTLANVAVSSSGDTEQFVVIDGVQYSHVVDPRTGTALTNRAQGTVIARDGLTSDPLSKLLTILEEKDWKKVLRAYPSTRGYARVLKGGLNTRGSD